jgi:hypothetical protein
MEEVITFKEDRISNTFLFALSIAIGCTSLERGPLGSGRDYKRTEKYFSKDILQLSKSRQFS